MRTADHPQMQSPPSWVDRQIEAAMRALRRGDIDMYGFDKLVDDILKEDKCRSSGCG